METLREVSRSIRDYVNDPRHQQSLLSARFSWHQLCTAMDVIDDVDLAIEAYLDTEFPSDDGEKYLRVYGVLQALFVQQDALRHLIGIIQPWVPVELSDVLKEVREIRNASVGHPTKLERKGGPSVHSISRNTLSREGFLMLSFDERNDTSFTDVQVPILIGNQRKEAVRILSEVVKQLKEKDRIHKKQFRGTKLENCFSQVLYAFEKISEETRQHAQLAMGKWGADHLQSSLDEFESSLKERGMNVDTYDSIKYIYNQVAYPLGELRKFFNSQGSDIPRREAAVVFWDVLRGHFSELMDIAKELDIEYSSEDEE
jgi:hypothetical protein